jgi:hypothetical protein
MEGERDRLAAQAMPPRAVFDSVFDDPETVRLGGGLNATYARALKRARRERGRLDDADYDRARAETEAYLDRFPPERQTAILRGAMVSAYLGETPESDAAVWLPGAKTETGRQPGIAHQSIRALREIGVLDEIAQTPEGLVAYPGASIKEPTYRTVGINGVWFHWYRAQCEVSSEAVPETMSDVPKDKAKWAKREVERLAGTEWRDLLLTVRVEGKWRVAYLPDGRLFGTLSRDAMEAPGDVIAIRFSVTRDGNLRSVIV